MSIGAPPLAIATGKHLSVGEGEIPAPIPSTVAGRDPDSYMWEQIHRVVRTSLANPPSESSQRLEEEKYMVVAQGVRVSRDDYQRRFEGIDLELFRSRMSPERFQAFVRFMGIVPGDSQLNIPETTVIPE